MADGLSTQNQIIKLLTELTGKQCPNTDRFISEYTDIFRSGKVLGYTQFNEILLLLEYDRIPPYFFQFLIDGTIEYNPGNGMNNLNELKEGVKRFRKFALYHFGNVKYAYKIISENRSRFIGLIFITNPIGTTEYKKRHPPLMPIKKINGIDTYYLGYLIQREIFEKLRRDPNDINALAEKDKERRITELGKRNHAAYLSSDHLDVYIATSMREKHEYLFVNEAIETIFKNKKLKSLNLRWFDPTQAYCTERIDKGLSEALMLKRARCTIYFMQENDTLGKDSELACTLAQGKPVIAYIPEVTDKYFQYLMKKLDLLYPNLSKLDRILYQLRLIYPSCAWEDREIRLWLDERKEEYIEKARNELKRRLKEQFDKRADTIKKSHPLGIQVTLANGVANGVLLVRNLNDCAELVYRIMTHNLEFELQSENIEGKEYLYLKEKISQSFFRVMTGDQLLTNSFWNFYLQ